MHLPSVILLPIILVTAPNFASACEGKCITAVTNAFLSNYTIPVRVALKNVADALISRCSQQHTTSGLSRLAPLISGYDSVAAKRMEKAIFPSYFHGKCQRPDVNNPGGPLVNPSGCPNPDCDVVCGTPGSMVHFYAKLRYIAFNATNNSLQDVASPGTPAYKAISRAFDAGMKARGISDPRASKTSLYMNIKESRITKHLPKKKDRCDLTGLKFLIKSELEKACGGVTNGLPECSWEKKMKEYILSFP